MALRHPHCGFLIFILVHAADIQDRDGAVDVLAAIRHRFPWLRHIFADGGYAGQKLRDALARIGKCTVEIIKRSDTAKGFTVLPRRWVAERTFAWLGRCKRLTKDWEKSLESSTAWALIASIRMITRRAAKYCYYRIRHLHYGQKLKQSSILPSNKEGSR